MKLGKRFAVMPHKRMRLNDFDPDDGGFQQG